MAIFTHITVGTNNLEAAREFYDSVLAPLGLKRIADMDHGSIWGVDGPEFFVLKPADGKPATVGNGLTVGFKAPNRAAIDEFHKRALAAGGTDSGAPGPRTFAPNAYAAYVRDLDGHKILASSMSGE
jgi:catechol 2,3-dioxygenase-like lactoylglutathione lyase family enzyme